MRGGTFLAWGIVVSERSYLSKALASPLKRWVSSSSDRILSASNADGNCDSPSISNYRAVLQREIIGKKMTLADDPAAMNRMIDDFYIPVYTYLKSQLDRHSKKHKGQGTRSPLFLGVSAPQGYGKTTLSDFMRHLFASEGIKCVAMSLDDFYLTGCDQSALAEANKGNALLEFRGNAGTHDLQLMHQTLESLRVMNIYSGGSNKSPGERESVLVPQYDKTLRAGRGDRSDRAKWINVEAPLDVVLFEGWMLGFNPIDSGTKSIEIDTNSVGINKNLFAGNMQSINENLLLYKPLHLIFDAWLVIALRNAESAGNAVGDPSADSAEMTRYSRNLPAGLRSVFRWRLQAEKAATHGLTDQQVEDFVSRFMPAYETYVPALYGTGPERREGVPVMMVTVDENRYPITSQLL